MIVILSKYLHDLETKQEIESKKSELIISHIRLLID